MKILAVDTATTSCSVAVIDNSSVCAELTTHKKQTHSKHLMTSIDLVLKTADCGAGDLDGFAVTVGPGSFTGLRIGMATIKGLASAVDKPVAGVSTLETLAWQCGAQTRLICPLLDARKAEVYAATYRLKNDHLIPETPACAVQPEAFVLDIREPCVFIGSGAQLYQNKIQDALGDKAVFVPDDQNFIRASKVAFLSLKRFKANETVGVTDLTPFYIRKSDAELSVAAKFRVQPTPNENGEVTGKDIAEGGN
ncbi:MAG: tRNA (adenosine(37)-N6)-threonylcarbamoyltransferase complex dimerization subunit type 1 TsaB [Desulfobacterales bacterium]|jgi:tRNA threonylcarbamoyladenosine biosynthesis protein TsaB